MVAATQEVELSARTIFTIRPTHLAALIVALLATGCAGGAGGKIYNAYYDPGYAPSDFGAMSAAGAPIELFGSPPGGASPEDIIASIQLPGASAAPKLAETPGQGQRLVFAFSSGGAVNGDALCSGGVQGGSAQDRLEVAGAFCRGERPLSQAQMSVSGPVGPPDPQFTSSMRGLIGTIGSSRNPNADFDN